MRRIRRSASRSTSTPSRSSRTTDPDTFWQTPHYEGWEGVLIRYDSPDEERVRDVIERSRDFVAAKPKATPRKRK